MSEKVTYIVCVILFAVLVALMILEAQNPQGGVELLQNLFS
ncbi:MAG: hypothetical protein Q4D60_06190 [Eubacteriales bacterium]|nr:hypothetical protein [Eubacteriales bacterium]